MMQRYAIICLSCILPPTLYRAWLNRAWTINLDVVPSSPVSIHGTTKQKFITYELIRGLEHYNGTFKGYIADCYNETHNYLPRLKEDGVMDFISTIETNLNIVYIGDSVGEQFVGSLQEAAGSSQDRQIIRYSYGKVINTHVAKGKGGGAIGGIRITGYWQKKFMNRGRYINTHSGGGWFESDVKNIKRLINHFRSIESTSNHTVDTHPPCETGNITDDNGIDLCQEMNADVVVHQFPVGWVGYKRLTLGQIDETVQMSFQYFGAKTVVLQTVPLTNNIRNMSDMVDVNRNMWEYAKMFESNTTHNVIIMDVGAFSVSLYLENSLAIGLVANDSGLKLQKELDVLRKDGRIIEYLNKTLELESTLYTKVRCKGHDRLVGLFCGNSSQTYDRYCQGTVASVDGMHWCINVVSGRFNAGLACLLRCGTTNNAIKDIQFCEARCNYQYMSLLPVSWDDLKSKQNY